MKRALIITLAALFCAVLLAGCTGSGDAEASETPALTTEDLSFKYIPLDENMGDWLP